MLRSSLIPLLVLLAAGSSSAWAQDMALSGVLLEGESWKLIGSGYKFTEGPAVDPQGQVYFTDVGDNKIYKIDLDDKVHVFVADSGATNGLMFGPDGRLYGCRNGDRTIVAYNSDGQPEVIADDVTSNDLVVAGNGGIYFTDPPNKQVWYISPDRKKRIVARDLSPNGVILWGDGGTLVVTESTAPHLWTFRVEPDGSLTQRERYYGPLQLPVGKDRPGSDGMTVDAQGRLYVATLAGLQMFDPTGRLGGTILKPQNSFLSNACFGGPQLDTLYITCTDKVYKRKTQATGVRYGHSAK